MSKLPEIITIPGIIDGHQHLREPGENKAETIASGTRAALMGAIVVVGDMGNNQGRPTTTFNRMMEKFARAQDSYIPIMFHPLILPHGENAEDLKLMTYCAMAPKIIAHPTTGVDVTFPASAYKEGMRVVHAAAPNKPFQVHHSPGSLEEFIGYGAQDLDHWVHFVHMHDSEEVDIIDRARRRNLKVSCEVTDKHLFLHDEDVKNWQLRMMPQLVTQVDSEKLMRQLIDGQIQMVATDHAPHSIEVKQKAQAENPNGEELPGQPWGTPSSEVAYLRLLKEVKLGNFTLKRFVEVTSTAAANLYGIKLSRNTQVTLETDEWVVGERPIMTGAGYLPYEGQSVVGTVKRVNIGGKTIVRDKKIIRRLPRPLIHRGVIV